MRYTEFRNAIGEALAADRDGMTWIQLRDRLDLPYDRPCPDWVKRLERDIGLRRTRGATRALVWRVTRRGRP